MINKIKMTIRENKDDSTITGIKGIKHTRTHLQQYIATKVINIDKTNMPKIMP